MYAQRKALRIDSSDNVATAIFDLVSGQTVRVDNRQVVLREPVPFGHKLALEDIPRGEYIIKYGARIGRATRHIQEGEHVHIQNVEDITDELRKEV